MSCKMRDLNPQALPLRPTLGVNDHLFRGLRSLSTDSLPANCHPVDLFYYFCLPVGGLNPGVQFAVLQRQIIGRFL